MKRITRRNQRILLRARSGTGGDPENEPYGFPGKPRMREMIPDKCRMNTIQAGRDSTAETKRRK